MALPVRVKAVKKDRRRLHQEPGGRLKPEARAAPTMTAKPIIVQFTGLISLMNPPGEPMFSTTQPWSLDLIKIVKDTYPSCPVLGEDRMPPFRGILHSLLYKLGYILEEWF
jgi:hypothetical protein